MKDPVVLRPCSLETPTSSRGKAEAVGPALQSRDRDAFLFPCNPCSRPQNKPKPGCHKVAISPKQTFLQSLYA